MTEVKIKISLEEVIMILEDLEFSGFEPNKDLMKRIIEQLPVPFHANGKVRDRIKYFLKKLIG